MFGFFVLPETVTREKQRPFKWQRANPLGAVVLPALQGRMSRVAADDQQGELQGVISSTRSVAAIVSPLVMTQIFWLATSTDGRSMPGAPFLLSSALMVVCMLVFLRIPRQPVSSEA